MHMNEYDAVGMATWSTKYFLELHLIMYGFFLNMWWFFRLQKSSKEKWSSPKKSNQIAHLINK